MSQRITKVMNENSKTCKNDSTRFAWGLWIIRTRRSSFSELKASELKNKRKLSAVTEIQNS